MNFRYELIFEKDKSKLASGSASEFCVARGVFFPPSESGKILFRIIDPLGKESVRQLEIKTFKNEKGELDTYEISAEIIIKNQMVRCEQTPGRTPKGLIEYKVTVSKIEPVKAEETNSKIELTEVKEPDLIEPNTAKSVPETAGPGRTSSTRRKNLQKS